MLLGLSALLYLGWIPLVQRVALSEVKIVAASACQSAIRNSPLTSLMWDRFSERIATLLELTENDRSWMSFAEVTRAELFIATPEIDGVEIPGHPGRGVDWKNSSFFKHHETFVPSDDIRFRSAINAATGESVPIILNTSFRGSKVSPFLLNDITNLGNSAVCRINYSPSVRLFGLKIYEDLDHARDVTIGFTNILQGVNTSPPLPPPEIQDDIQSPVSLPGISIAVAPHIDRSTGELFELFPESFLNMPGLNLAFFGQSPSIRENSRNFGELTLPSLTTRKSTGYMGEPPEVTARKESCLNPVAMVRNAFLSALMEILARDGRFRHSTEVLFVNSTVDGESGDFNVPPTLAVEKGMDLTKQSFRAPYSLINYRGFKVSGYDYEINGILNKISLGGNLTAATGAEEVRALTLAQIPQCTHLYASGGKPFNSPYSVSRITEPTNFNAATEFEINQSEISWQYDGEIIPPVTASELLSQIGALRLCPYRSSLLDMFCKETQDVRIDPDIKGLAQYWSGGSALSNPGALGPVAPGSISIFEGQDKLDRINDFPILILVAHNLTSRLVRELGEWYQTSTPNIVGSAGPIRPIRLVLFPYSMTKLSEATELKDLLENNQLGRPGLNSVLSIEPCERNESGEFIYPSYCQNSYDPGTGEYKPSEVNRFWRDLLYNPDIKPNIYDRALNFYRNYLTYTMQVL